MISAVVEFTHFNIEEVFRMPAVDFFIYLEFINERNRRKWIEQKMELDVKDNAVNVNIQVVE